MKIPRSNTILGQTGTGKSRLLQCLLAHHQPKRLIVCDTMAEHANIAEHVTLDALYDMREDETLAAGVIPSTIDELKWVCNLAASCMDTTLVIDEYAAWWNVAQRQPARGLLMIARAGRKLNQHLYVTTQSPSTINKGIVSQTAVWAFPMQEPLDRKYVQSVTRDAVDPADLRVLDSDGADGIYRTEVACYDRGVLRRFELDNTIPELIEQ